MIVYGALRYEPLWGKILIKISHLLLCLSSAVNIIIYSYKDFQFRSILLKNCQCTSEVNDVGSRIPRPEEELEVFNNPHCGGVVVTRI